MRSVTDCERGLHRGVGECTGNGGRRVWGADSQVPTAEGETGLRQTHGNAAPSAGKRSSKVKSKQTQPVFNPEVLPHGEDGTEAPKQKQSKKEKRGGKEEKSVETS